MQFSSTTDTLFNGRSRPVVPGVAWGAIASPDQLTLSQPEGADYTHQIIYKHNWHSRIFKLSYGPEIYGMIGQKTLLKNIFDLYCFIARLPLVASNDLTSKTLYRDCPSQDIHIA